MAINSAANTVTLSERLRNFRDSRGLSRADLAMELGITPITLYRWEMGSSRPSPLAVEKLRTLGFGEVSPEETNTSTIARLKTGKSKSEMVANAAGLRAAGWQLLKTKRGSIRLLVAPFVRNGPPDQAAFHRRLLELQVASDLPLLSLGRRLSLVEEVENEGPTAQHLLESPRQMAVSWSSNYGTHGWHRYVGRFPPHVVRALLNHFGASSDSVVCDPFVGSGTTAVECRLLGIPFVGIEICPLSAMITRVKAAFPNNSNLLLGLRQEFIAFYLEKWNEFVDSHKTKSFRHIDVLGRKGNQIQMFSNLEQWFTPEALLGTSIAVEFGMSKQGYSREAVLVALSAKMRSIGNVDVDVVRAEYSKAPRENVDVGHLVARQLKKMAGDISESLSTHSGVIGSDSGVTLFENSVLDVELAPESIDHIITSPPYGVEAISYLRTHLLSYRSLVAHLGHDPYETRDKTIGSEYLTDSDTNAGERALALSGACHKFFAEASPTGDSKYAHRRSAMMQFCDDMLSVGERMARWLKPNGRVAFIIGNKRLGDDVMPMDQIVTELFSSCGLEPTDSIRHKLKTNNSNSQVPWQERVIQEESILLFKRSVK